MVRGWSLGSCGAGTSSLPSTSFSAIRFSHESCGSPALPAAYRRGCVWIRKLTSSHCFACVFTDEESKRELEEQFKATNPQSLMDELLGGGAKKKEEAKRVEAKRD